MKSSQWTMDNGQWTMDNGQWTINNYSRKFLLEQKYWKAFGTFLTFVVRIIIV